MSRKFLNLSALLTPKTSMVLFSILVVGMPFIMLQNYLQNTFRSIGSTLISVLGWQIPLVLLIVLPPLIVLAVINYSKFTKVRLLSAVFIILMLYLGQSVSDFYINYKFYDLQNNWHYIAYCLYTVIMYRYMITRGVPLHKIIIITFLRGLAISLFDEGIQVFISNRIFDLSDVAKDLWGLWLGNIVIFFLIDKGEIWKQFKIYHKTAKEYFSSPLSLILLQGVFSFIFMYFSAKLTDSKYWLELALLVVLFCIIAFYLIHFSQKKLIRNIIISAFSLIILGLGISYFINKDKGISSISDGIIIYKGLPIIYFDLLLTPDGGIHLVDKKEHLKKGDFLKLYDFQPDIIITAHTEQRNSPNRLYHYNPMKNTYFTYNPYTKTGVQILNLNYEDAIKEYNRLSKTKRTAIVIHNSHTNVN